MNKKHPNKDRRLPDIQGQLMTERAREDRARARLRRGGYRLLKSNPHLHDQGGYPIVEASINGVVAGSDFDLSLDDVEGWMEE